MKRWHRDMVVANIQEIQEAVNNDNWQTFRKALKGKSTETKLDLLEHYCATKEEAYGRMSRKDQVRVSNYVNALLRGGQLHWLDGQIMVQR